MKGKLLKVENGYVLLVGDQVYTTDDGDISMGDCRNIDFGYDIEDLVSEHENEYTSNSGSSFRKGFMKCREILIGNKNEYLWDEWGSESIYESINKKTEWEVEIETEENPLLEDYISNSRFKYFPEGNPKITNSGFLVFKEIK